MRYVTELKGMKSDHFFVASFLYLRGSQYFKEKLFQNDIIQINRR